MARLGAQLTCLGRLRTVEETVEEYQAVDADAVADVIGRVLRQPRTVAAVGPVNKRAVFASPGSAALRSAPGR
jgi:predicted Zn-dependent peptidase